MPSGVTLDISTTLQGRPGAGVAAHAGVAGQHKLDTQDILHGICALLVLVWEFLLFGAIGDGGGDFCSFGF